MRPKDLLGLLASVGIQNFPSFVPLLILETDKTVAIEHPHPIARFHYVIMPKKDIKNIADLTENDREFLIDAYAVARQIIEEKRLTHYRFYTNGAGFQDMTYLHFHLVADDATTDDDDIRAREIMETDKVR